MNKNKIASALSIALITSGLQGCMNLNPWGSDESAAKPVETNHLETPEEEIFYQANPDDLIGVMPNFESLDPLYSLGSDGDFEKGLAAYSEKRYAQALVEWYPMAKEKNPQAEYYLGVMYLNGLGLPYDATQGRIWLQRSANRGYDKAQFELGQLYIAGQQIEKNLDQGIRWLLSAARQGHAGAQFSYGLLYQQDKVPLSSNLMAVYQQTQSQEFNFQQAAKWYRTAADQNHGAAQNNLAWLYLIGKGVEQSDALAIKWYTDAANQGVIDAQYNLGLLYEQGRGAPLDLQEALFWHSKAADQGYLSSQQRLPVLQQKIDESNSNLMLYGSTLSLVTRQAMRARIKNNGGIKLREADNYWFDSYESSQLVEGSDRLFAGYSLQTGNLGSLEYRFPSYNDPNFALKVVEMITDKYGEPVAREGELNTGRLQYTWEAKDTTIVVSRFWPDTTVYLSYRIGNAYRQLRSEMPENAEELKYNVELETY